MNALETLIGTDTLPIHSHQFEQRFILVRLAQLTFVFPATIVAEILIIERSKVLALPFYDSAILGVVHHRGQIIPLVSMHQIVGIPVDPSGESLTAVRLSGAAGELAGLGLVVDRTLGSSSPDRLPPDLFSTGLLPDSTKTDTKMRLFRPEILGGYLWRPQRWSPSA